MKQNFLARWGFIIAGIIFLIAAVIQYFTGRIFKASFFVIGLAFLVIGAAAFRKKPAESSAKK